MSYVRRWAVGSGRELPEQTGPRLHRFVGALDPVKEIGQTCGLTVIMRRNATSDRRMVTAAKLRLLHLGVPSIPGERHGKAIYRNRSAPRPVHLLHATGERQDVPDHMETGRAAAVCEEATIQR